MQCCSSVIAAVQVECSLRHSPLIQAAIELQASSAVLILALTKPGQADLRTRRCTPSAKLVCVTLSLPLIALMTYFKRQVLLGSA